MLVKSYKDVVPYRIQEGDARGSYVRPLLNEDDGAGDFFMNLLRIEPGGNSTTRRYDHCHQMFIRKGDGELVHSSNSRELKEGDVVFAREEEEYQIRNNSDSDLEILMVIPADADHLTDETDEGTEQGTNEGEADTPESSEPAI